MEMFSDCHDQDQAELARFRATEQKVKDYIVEITNNQVGAGEDPIGFLIASHSLIRGQLKDAKIEINQLQMDITEIMSYWEQDY